jgi:hypothetical protein
MNRLSTALFLHLGAGRHRRPRQTPRTHFGEGCGSGHHALPGLSQYAPASAAGTNSCHRPQRLDAGGAHRGWRTRRTRIDLAGVSSNPRRTDGKLPLLATSEGGSATVRIRTGRLFHSRRLRSLRRHQEAHRTAQTGPLETQRLVLEAGGLVLNAVSGVDMRIPVQQLRFNIYKAEEALDGEQQLVVENVRAEHDRPAQRRHLPHRLRVWRGQCGDPLGHPRRAGQAHRSRHPAPRRATHPQAGVPRQAARPSPIRPGPF